MSGITLAHTFVSLKGNGTDLTLIQPSNWNDQHIIKLDSGNLIGRLTAGNGPAEQVALSAFMATLLAAADSSALAALIGLSSTGDGKLTLKTTPDAGWLMLDDGTFGGSGSGASNRANADCQALFTLIYNNISDAGAPVQTSVGGASTRAAQGSAATAFAASCRLSLPKQLGRAFVGAGAGAGLTSRGLGTNFGALAAGITLVNANLPPYTPSGTVSTGGTIPGSGSPGALTNQFAFGSGSSSSLSYASTSTFTGNPQGGTSTPFDVTQASAAWNVMVKL